MLWSSSSSACHHLRIFTFVAAELRARNSTSSTEFASAPASWLQLSSLQLLQGRNKWFCSAAVSCHLNIVHPQSMGIGFLLMAQLLCGTAMLKCCCSSMLAGTFAGALSEESCCVTRVSQRPRCGCTCVHSADMLATGAVQQLFSISSLATCIFYLMKLPEMLLQQQHHAARLAGTPAGHVCCVTPVSHSALGSLRLPFAFGRDVHAQLSSGSTAGRACTDDLVSSAAVWYWQ